MSMWIFKIYFWHQMKPTEILHIKPKSRWQTSETGVPVPTRSWGTLQLPVAFTKVALALCKELCPLHIFSAISLRNSSWKKKKIPGIFSLFGGTPTIHMMIIQMERNIRGTKEIRTSQLFSVYSSSVTVPCFLPLAEMFSRATHSLTRWKENGIYISQCVWITRIPEVNKRW